MEHHRPLRYNNLYREIPVYEKDLVTIEPDGDDFLVGDSRGDAIGKVSIGRLELFGSTPSNERIGIAGRILADNGVPWRVVRHTAGKHRDIMWLRRRPEGMFQDVPFTHAAFVHRPGPGWRLRYVGPKALAPVD
mgnify:CR=1 FL=1